MPTNTPLAVLTAALRLPAKQHQRMFDLLNKNFSWITDTTTISAENLANFRRSAQECQCRRINFHRFTLSPFLMRELFEGLKTNSNVTTLQLEGMSLTDDDMPVICDFISSSPAKLKEINLAHNPGITDESYDRLKEALQANENMHLISVRGTSMSLTSIFDLDNIRDNLESRGASDIRRAIEQEVENTVTNASGAFFKSNHTLVDGNLAKLLPKERRGATQRERDKSSFLSRLRWNATKGSFDVVARADQADASVASDIAHDSASARRRSSSF